MDINPKEGGRCWSCKHCEDIATQTNNPSGSYYRKCTKSGHEYVDTCKFHCTDYVWDGKHEENVPSTHTSSASVSSPSSVKTSAPSTSKVAFKLIAALLTTAAFAFIGYLLLEYAEYLLAAALDTTSSLPIFQDAFTIESIIVFAPVVLSILWSIIRRRKIWIGALLTMLACSVIGNTIGGDTTPAHIPLFIVSVVVPYLLCLVAILGRKKQSVSTSSTTAANNKTSSATPPTTTKTYADYKCYQCSYYKVDADYNGICARNNTLVDRYQTACKNCSR